VLLSLISTKECTKNMIRKLCIANAPVYRVRF
jgi:hypothetical protein